MLYTLPTLGRITLAGQDLQLVELAPGVYRPSLDHNFDLDMQFAGYKTDPYPFKDRWVDVMRLSPGTPEHGAAYEKALASPNDYGVCDSWEQVIEQWPELVTSDRKFVLGVTEVRRQDQPSRDGWRWHKWGEYIGTRTPTAEYLADETDIEQVWTFNILEVLSGPGVE